MDYFSEKYKRIAIFVTFLFVVISSLVFLYIRLNSNQNLSDSTLNVNQTSKKYNGPPPAPAFKKWIESKNGLINTAQTNDQSTVYTFRKDYSAQELSKLSSFFNVTEEPEAGGYSVFTNYATDSASLLLFKKTDGSLSYISTNGIPLVSKDDLPNEIIKTVTALGIYDSNIKVTASYRRKSRPGIQYFELHRDWKEIGYPIFNPVGLLNLSENELLKNLSFTTRDEYYKDTDIYDSSDLNNAYARKTDFNTMTIAVDEDKNSIISINSNIRPILTTNSIVSKPQLLTKDEAMAKLKKGEQSIFLSTPAGEGFTDFTKVYPNNTATGQEAVIEESIIAYLENARTNQKTLEQYYLFKGYSELASGYRVRFIAAVPALKNNNVAGVSTIAQGIGGQQQGTLTFPTGSRVTNTPIPTEFIPNLTTTTIPTLTSVITQKSPQTISIEPFKKSCLPSESDFLIVYEFEGLKYGVAYSYGNTNSHWYLLPSENLGSNTDEIIKALNKVADHIKKNHIEVPITPIHSLDATTRALDGIWIPSLEQDILRHENCPIQITGGSPSLFVYSRADTLYKIIPKRVLYNDPSLVENAWNVRVKGDNTLIVNDVNRNYIYYEYNPVAFTKPSEGWVIKQNNLAKFSSTIADQLKLNKWEEARLLFEFKHATFYINDNYLFIGIINKSEIDKKLPLSISPQIQNIQRYHFYVEGLQSRIRTKQPVVNPIDRSEPMVLELGALNGK